MFLTLDGTLLFLSPSGLLQLLPVQIFLYILDYGLSQALMKMSDKIQY